jgi:DNA-binding transcriptional MerR regulator
MPARPTLTIDQLAAATGTTSRRIRSYQTLGLLPHPELRGRTGLYGDEHLGRVSAIRRLQDRGFSLESLVVLFAALEAGHTLGDVLGVAGSHVDDASAPAPIRPAARRDDAELYGFNELETGRSSTAPSGRPLLSLVPTTMWGESEAS